MSGDTAETLELLLVPETNSPEKYLIAVRAWICERLARAVAKIHVSASQKEGLWLLTGAQVGIQGSFSRVRLVVESRDRDRETPLRARGGG